MKIKEYKKKKLEKSNTEPVLNHRFMVEFGEDSYSSFLVRDFEFASCPHQSNGNILKISYTVTKDFDFSTINKFTSVIYLKMIDSAGSVINTLKFKGCTIEHYSMSMDYKFCGAACIEFQISYINMEQIKK